MPTTGLETTSRTANGREASGTMRALVYDGPRQRVWKDKPRPTLRDLVYQCLRTCDLCRRGMYSHCRTGGWISVTRSTAPEREQEPRLGHLLRPRADARKQAGEPERAKIAGSQGWRLSRERI